MLVPIRADQPRDRFPGATLWLITANALLFAAVALLGSDAHAELLRRAGAVPLEVSSLHDLPPANVVAPPFTILTSLFLHAGILHLVGNMWFLWLFGGSVERRLGPLRFAAFYLIAGVVGALAQCLLMPASAAPMVGASGAVAGVLGGYFLLFPGARIVSLSLIGLVAVRAWIFLGLWFAAQLFIADHSGIAWMAHVGGFLSGLGMVRLFLGGRVCRVEAGPSGSRFPSIGP